MLRFLVLEDNDQDRAHVISSLKAVSPDAEIVTTDCGDDAAKIASGSHFDCCIFDRQVNGMDGLSCLVHLRKSDYVRPIIMLTSLNEAAHVLEGISQAATFYLTKPFETKALEAYVRNAINRHEVKFIKVGPLTVFPESETADWSGKKLNLTPLEYRLMDVIARKYSRISDIEGIIDPVATRDELWKHGWPNEYQSPRNTVIEVSMSRLRSKICGDIDPIEDVFDRNAKSGRNALRIRHVKSETSEKDSMAFGPLLFRMQERKVLWDGVDTKLLPDEFATLRVLTESKLERDGRLQAVDQETLFRNVWPNREPRSVDDDMAFQKLIKNLRTKLNAPISPIEVVKGVGYRLNLSKARRVAQLQSEMGVN